MTALPSTRAIGPDRDRVFDSPVGLLASLIASRPQRVALVILACMLMGLADLACTLAYVGGVGMIESNPLARFIIQTGGASWLIAFKLVTMAVTGGCLYMSRHYAMGERCAWICCAVLTALSVHWMNYNEAIVSPENLSETILIASMNDYYEVEGWVRFD